MVHNEKEKGGGEKRKNEREEGGKMKGKRKKAIMGILLALIMVSSVIAVIVQMGSARDAGGAIEVGDIVYSGEHGLDVSAIIASGGTFYGMADTTADGGLLTVADATSWNVPATAKLGPYNKTSREGTIADIIVDEPEITGNVYLAGTFDSIVAKCIPVGTAIKIRAMPNFGGIMNDSAHPGNWSKIKIKLFDPDGVQVITVKDTTGAAIGLTDIDANATEIDIDNIDTKEWDTGTWKVKIVSDKATCNEVDVSSPEYEFTLRSSELSIDAVKEVVYKGEDIILTVTGYPNYYYYFAVENVTAGEEPYIKDTADIVSFGTGEGSPGAATAAWIKTGSDGIADIKICTCGADERIYTMHIYDTYHVAGAVPNETDDFAAPADVTGAKDEDEEKVKLEPVKVTFDIPKIVVIGDEVMIKGTVSGGNKIDVLIEDGDIEYFNDQLLGENKEFEVEWDTVGLTEGSYKIDVYIDCPFDSFEEIEAAGIEPDGSTIIRLISYPHLDANLSKDTAPIGGSFEIYGNASFDYVEIVAISPNGGNGTGLDGLYGISIYTVPAFNPDETGSYKIHVFIDRTDSVGGTAGFYNLNETRNLILEEPIEINGTTNRPPGTNITINITGPETDKYNFYKRIKVQ